MSNADKIFVKMCTDILTNGTDTKGERVRPIWKDTGEKAYTKKIFGHVARYDLREEFPALTLRKTGIKSAINEVLWIFQKKSNNIHDLKPHIWDSWADPTGSIGKAYGYQIGKKFKTHGMMMDQMDNILFELKNTPYSRRMITSIYNHSELNEMNLYPCCWSLTFNVTDEGYDKLVLNCVLNQRSNDVLAANNWNVVQYSALLMMVAQAVDMIPGVLLHVIADAHIYDRHIPIVEKLIKREQYDAPIVTLDKTIKNFYEFTEDSFRIENYKTGEQVKNIPIAV